MGGLGISDPVGEGAGKERESTDWPSFLLAPDKCEFGYVLPWKSPIEEGIYPRDASGPSTGEDTSIHQPTIADDRHVASVDDAIVNVPIYIDGVLGKFAVLAVWRDWDVGETTMLNLWWTRWWPRNWLKTDVTAGKPSDTPTVVRDAPPNPAIERWPTPPEGEVEVVDPRDEPRALQRSGSLDCSPVDGGLYEADDDKQEGEEGNWLFPPPAWCLRMGLMFVFAWFGSLQLLDGRWWWAALLYGLTFAVFPG